MNNQDAINLLSNAELDVVTVRDYLESLNGGGLEWPAVPVYGQQWSPWGDDRLGFHASYTLASWGCLVASAAMVTSYFLNKRITPGNVNARMKEVGGFVNGGSFVFVKLPDAYPGVKYDGIVFCDYVPAPVGRIDDHLAAGGLVIVKVDFKMQNGGVQQHWLPLTGVQSDGVYYASDPWAGAQVLFPPAYCDMGNPDPSAARWIFAAAFYSKV